MPTDTAETLLYLAPGFVGLKVFYLVGMQGRRTDLELTIGGILVGAALQAIVLWGLPQAELGPRVIVAVVIGVATGWAVGQAWKRIERRWPRIGSVRSRRAWDDVLSIRPTPWIQVWLGDGKCMFGWPERFALDAVADTLDLYLCDPAWVDEKGDRDPMVGVDGVLIPETSISFVQIYRPLPSEDD